MITFTLSVRALVRACTVVGVAVLASSSAAYGQGVRARPVRIIVPSQPGGAADVIARKIGFKLTELRGQQAVIDNRVGVLGAEIVAQAAPDGNTMLFSPDSLIMREAVYEKLPYKTLRDFEPVTLAVVQPNVIAVQAASSVKSVQDLVALARSRPGQVSYASAGNGSAQHMAGALLQLLARIDVLHVPYKGVPQATADLLGGRVDYLFGSPVSILPHVRENRLRVLAVTTAKRATFLPEVPTVAESGVPRYEYTGWLALFVPKRTPTAIVESLHTDVARFINEADLKQLITTGGTEPLGNTPGEFTAQLRSEIKRWTQVARDARITAD